MSKNALRYPEDDYLRYDPYEGDEAEIRCRTTKLVKVRKPHACFMGANPHGGDNHVIQPGELARFETALVDGDFWGKSYVCIGCVDKWLGDVLGDRDE
jgi:hypothetical protein